METRKIYVKSQSCIPLGIQGENHTTEIIFTRPEHLQGSICTLLHQRATDASPYPVAVTQGDNVVWDVTSGDTAISGRGLAQLIYSGSDGAILKTYVYSTDVQKSLDTPADPPDPVKPWYDAIMDAIASGGGGSGKPSEDGGYYSPAVEQRTEDTLTIGYSPSKKDMPAVEPVTVRLPAGPQGTNGLSMYCIAEDSEETEALFMLDNISLNGRSLQMGDLLLTPTGRVYTVTGLSLSVIDAAYTMTLGGSGQNPGPGETITHGIIWDLSNVISSNNVSTVSAGAALVAVLTPADGYTLGDVTVTMGGVTLAGAWNAATATVIIDSVTGDVVVTCAGIAQGAADTSPVIAQTGYAYRCISTTAPNTYLAASKDQCITKVYEFTPDVAAIEAHPAYDADLGYIDLANAMGQIKHFVPNATFLANGGTDVNATYKKAAFFVDGELQTNIFGNLRSQTEEGAISVADKKALQKTINGVAFSLYTDDIDNSYAYWDKGIPTAVLPVGVNAGDVIFAGKNTKYYGMTNIYGAASTSVDTLSVDADIARDYPIATASLLGEEIAEDPKSTYGINADFAAEIDAVRTAWMTGYGGDYRKIPLIIHTDQHGRLNNTWRGIFNMLGSVLSWHDVSKVCNLGDTISVEWYDADTDHPLRTNATLDLALKCVEKIPFSKRLDVYGNHDTWYGNYNDEGNPIGTRYPPTQERLYQYFRNIYARRTNNNGWFSVTDDYFNVKYVVVSSFEYANGSGAYRIGSDQMTWLIEELGKNDGYDIIIMSHVPIYYAVDTAMHPTGMPEGGPEGVVSRLADIDTDALFNGRKNKTSGTVTDSEGVEHQFDFSGCATDVLCNLAGHIHSDAYNYVANADNGLVSAVFDRFINGCIHFILVDRVTRVLDVWKVHYPDSVPTTIHYQIPLDKPAESNSEEGQL